MGPTFDTVCLHELVHQREHELRRQAETHARLPRRRAGSRSGVEPGRVRSALAAALHHLADRIAPPRLTPRPAAR